MRVLGKFITTVANKPGERYHKHLYGKLQSVLKGEGKWLT